MSHTLCITKVFNSAFTTYKNNWRSCLIIGAIAGIFWFAEKRLGSHISVISTFCKYELPQSKHAPEFFFTAKKAIQYHLTFPFAYRDYIILCILGLLLLYGQLCMNRFFLLLYSKKTTPKLSTALVPVETFFRTIAAYLFVLLTMIVATILGAVLLKVGEWFLLSPEHNIIVLTLYIVGVVIPFLLSFGPLTWVAVDGSPSISEIIDTCFAITKGNKPRIFVVFILIHLLSYILQFCFLRITYWPLHALHIFEYGAFVALALIIPLKQAAWASVYQQIK